MVAAPLALLAQESLEPPRLELTVSPREAEIGDWLSVTLTVDYPAQTRFEPAAIGPQLGPFSVEEGSWSEVLESEAGVRWVWAGRLAAYRTGELVLPTISLSAIGPGGEILLSSEPVTVTLRSVLDDRELEQGDAELADLKPPASVPAQYGPLWTALAVLASLLAGAGLLWWLHRRYGSRLAAVAVPEDPFHRTPPHVWIYAELQQLLERSLPEQGRIDLFYGELSRLLKRYLSGRFRVELMEHTSDEAPVLLRQAGATDDAILRVQSLLGECDRVKFARLLPEAAAWRTAVEQVYRIVDTTKPLESVSDEARKGAA
jgi:hypothetical protein